jgi:hypothetical protein
MTSKKCDGRLIKEMKQQEAQKEEREKNQSRPAQ